MWRVAFLCTAVLTLTVACADGPGAPNVNTDELFLDESSDPPPPPVEGTGFASFSPSGSDEGIGATEIVTQEVCVPPEFSFVVEGDYFQNIPGNSASIHFTPVPGSGTGNIHETENKQDASGSIVAVADNTGEEHRIHLVDYNGLTLFQPQREFGTIFGQLEAVVVACDVKTPYTGFISFEWGVPPPYAEGEF